jgi:hypothetical protein
MELSKRTLILIAIGLLVLLALFIAYRIFAGKKKSKCADKYKGTVMFCAKKQDDSSSLTPNVAVVASTDPPNPLPQEPWGGWYGFENLKMQVPCASDLLRIEEVELGEFVENSTSKITTLFYTGLAPVDCLVFTYLFSIETTEDEVLSIALFRKTDEGITIVPSSEVHSHHHNIADTTSNTLCFSMSPNDRIIPVFRRGGGTSLVPMTIDVLVANLVVFKLAQQ